MFRTPVIQKILSTGMLVLFAFSITPKQFLHNLVADHKDKIACQDNLATHHVHSAGFYCDCDNLVAESVFISNVDAIEISTPGELIENTPIFSSIYYYISDFFSDLRGPPASV